MATTAAAAIAAATSLSPKPNKRRNERPDERTKQPKTLAAAASGRSTDERAPAPPKETERALDRPNAGPIPLSLSPSRSLCEVVPLLEGDDVDTRGGDAFSGASGCSGGGRAGRADRDALLVECQCGEREEGRGLGRTDGRKRGGRRRAKSYTRPPRKTAEEE